MPASIRPFSPAPLETASNPLLVRVPNSDLNPGDFRGATAQPDTFETTTAAAVGRVDNRMDVPVTKKVAVFYRFGNKAEIDSLLKTGGLSVANVGPFVSNDVNLKGDGIYLAESPITAQMYGDYVAEVWVDQELIDQGHFEKFGGIIGGDWWLGQIDDILEEKGIDVSRLELGGYNGDADAEKIVGSVGVHYRPFEGSALPRGKMETLITYSEREKKPLFREILAERTYLWTTEPDGKLSAIEYTANGYEIGPLDPKYCNERNKNSFKPYSSDVRGGVAVSSLYDGLEPVGFENDLKALSQKGFVHRAWEGYRDLRDAITNWFG